MKTLYFNCFSGISGDMCLGAFVDAGIDIGLIAEELKKLPINDYQLIANRTIRSGIVSTKVDVIIHEAEHKHKRGRKWEDIAAIISSSSLSEWIKERGLLLFKMFFDAEAKIHGKPYDKIHLHELGAVDCLVDIFGTLIALEFFEVERIYTSEINLGGGSVKSFHGILPVPAPATMELLKSYPVYSFGTPFELTTPTGALIISGLNAIYSPLPNMIVEKIGYGAGNRDIKDMPNLLRILIGKEPLQQSQLPIENMVTVIETNIDDMNPQLYEDVMERLFNAGALDVALENIIMKKGRPAIKLTIMAYEKALNSLAQILFRDTTTIGIRFYNAQRITLDRETKTIKTRLGDVRIKISRLGGRVVNISPEYDDLKILSKTNNLPIKKIDELILSEIPWELL